MTTKIGTIVADFQTQLATAILAGGTSATLQSCIDSDGVALPNGWYFFTLDWQQTYKEYIICQLTVTDGIGYITNINNVSRQGVIGSSGTVQPNHRVGGTVVITDFADLVMFAGMLGGTVSLMSASPLYYDSNFVPTIGDFQVACWDYIKSYIDGISIAGSPDATTTSKGIGRLSYSPNKTIGAVTLTVASPCVLTSAAHGLTIGDTVILTTSGSLPTGLSANTVYYVISAGLTTNTFELSATAGGTALNTTGTQSGTHTLTKVTPVFVSDTDPRMLNLSQVAALAGDDTSIPIGTGNKVVTQTGLQNGAEKYATSTGSASLTVGNPTISIATPAVITLAAHGLSIGDAVVFTSTGSLPTGLALATTYYVIASGFTSGAFEVSATRAGSAIATSGTQSGTQTVARVASIYEVAYSPVPVTLVAGQQFAFNANFSNTGAAMLNVNGLGAVAIAKNVSGSLSVGDIASGQIVSVSFDGTSFQLNTQHSTSNSVAATTTSTSVSSGSNTDVTGSSIGLTTVGKPVLISFAGTGQSNSNAGGGNLYLVIDGGSAILVGGQQNVSGVVSSFSMGFSYLKTGLAAGAHTFKLQIVETTGGAFTLAAGNFSAIEI